MRSLWVGWHAFCPCGHGCDDILIPNDLLSLEIDHPVSSFMDQFFNHDRLSRDGWCNTLQTAQGETVLNDEKYRGVVSSILIRIGTNMLLNGEHLDWVSTLAKAIAVLETFGGEDIIIDTAFYNRKLQTKMRDLQSYVGSVRRDVLKFYSKRVSCKCLVEMHQETRRTIPKMGMCYGCKEEMERVSLSVCSRCMIIQYCSRECQVSHWPRHIKDCDMLTSAHKQLTADENVKMLPHVSFRFREKDCMNVDVMRQRIKQNSMQLSKFEQQEGL